MFWVTQKFDAFLGFLSWSSVAILYTYVASVSPSVSFIPITKNTLLNFPVKP